MEQKKKSIMFYEICRLCLDEHGYCCIYEKDCLSADIYMCTGVKVTPADNLPQRICKNCLNIVNMATELRKKAKRNQCHLNSLFGGDDEKETKESEDAMETVTSTHFEEKNYSPLKNNSAIENFLKVRMDLFESSVAEDSLVTSETTQLNSKQLKLNSKQKTSQKRKNHDNSNDEDEICETYCIIENSINMSESSQPDSSQSSQKPQSQKKTKLADGGTYECDVCSKKFNKYKKLYLHHRVHSKNLVCPIDVCGKKFSTKADLQKHIRTHTGEKPYACDMCDKSFAQRGTLKAHKLSVHSAG